MYTFDVNRLSISFEITNEDYFAIEQRDRDRDDAASDRGEDVEYLFELINKVEGVSNSDYNGHFGPYVFFDLDAENDSPAKREEIKTLIVNYINGQGEFA